MNNGCKTYQQATLEMLWLGTQSRSIDVIHAVADQEEGPEGPAPPQLRPECRKKFFWRVPPPPPPPPGPPPPHRGPQGQKKFFGGGPPPPPRRPTPASILRSGSGTDMYQSNS